MGHTVYQLQNAVNNPTIVIKETDKNWEEAKNNWQNLREPTKDKRWQSGVFAIVKLA